MAYDMALAGKIRVHLAAIPGLEIKEKKMFGGLAFLVNGKMCINVSGHKLMCRFDPVLQEQVEKRNGYQPMIMKGKSMSGYCYVETDGFKTKKDFEFWMKICLDFNDKAKASEK